MSEDKKIEIISNIRELLEFRGDKQNLDRYLFVFDMDDVLIKGVESIGSDTWFHKCMIKGRPILNVLENMGYAYSIIQYEPVEPETRDVIKELIDLPNVDYIILTSRGMVHYSQTLKHLRDSGMADLMVRPNMLNIRGADDIVVKGVEPNSNDPDCYPRLRQVRYIDNICFCAGNDKGLVLEEIVSRVYESSPKKRYKYILLVEDSIQNVNKVHNQFMRPIRKNIFKNTNTYAIHYSYMEIFKRRYDDEALKEDDQKMRYMRNAISYMNGKTVINYVISWNVLLGISVFWWFIFRFLGLITC